MRQVLLLLLFITPRNAQAQLRLSVFDCVRLSFDDVSAFWIEHSLELAETLNLAPAYYD